MRQRPHFSVALRGTLGQLQARHHFLRNELPSAMASAREALELLPLGTVHWFHAAGIATITTFSHQRDPGIARYVANSLEDLPDVKDQDWPFVWAVNYAVWVFFHVGRYAEAIRLAAWAERAVARQPEHDPMFVTFLHALRAQIAFMEGDPGAALREARLVVCGLDDESPGLSVNLAIAVFVASLILLHLGCLEELGMLTRRAWRRESDLPALRQFRGLGLAVHQLSEGNAAPLVAIGERFVETTNLFMNSAVRAYVAEAHLAEGRPDVAELFARPVVESGCPGTFQKEAQAILARAALVRGDPRAALAITESGTGLRDPDSQARFLDRLPDNRRTLELAENLLGSA